MNLEFSKSVINTRFLGGKLLDVFHKTILSCLVDTLPVRVFWILIYKYKLKGLISVSFIEEIPIRVIKIGKVNFKMQIFWIYIINSCIVFFIKKCI